MCNHIKIGIAIDIATRAISMHLLSIYSAWYSVTPAAKSQLYTVDHRVVGMVGLFLHKGNAKVGHGSIYTYYNIIIVVKI